MKTDTNPLQSIPLDTPLYDLTSGQLEALESWYNEINEISEGDSLRSILGNGHMWSMELGAFVAQQIASATQALQEDAQ